MMAFVIFGLTVPQLVLAVAFVVLAPLVLYYVLRSSKQMLGSRMVYQNFAGQIGVEWSPPKNASDTLGPGRVKGRYREHKLTVDSTTPVGGNRDLLPETVIRVKFERSLGLGINGGSGSFRARKPHDVPLADARLSKALRLTTKDPDGTRRLLDQPEVAQALLTLDQRCGGVSIDDGCLACLVPLPTSFTELHAHVDAVVEAVTAVDRGAA